MKSVEAVRPLSAKYPSIPISMDTCLQTQWMMQVSMIIHINQVMYTIGKRKKTTRNVKIERVCHYNGTLFSVQIKL